MMQQRFDIRPVLQQRLDELDTRRRQLIDARKRVDEELERIMEDQHTVSDMLELECRLYGEPEPAHEQVADGRLASMGLRDAVALLRREDSNITRAAIRQRLESVSFDFKGKKPGNAINMAWVSLDAQARKKDGSEG